MYTYLVVYYSRGMHAAYILTQNLAYMYIHIYTHTSWFAVRLIKIYYAN